VDVKYIPYATVAGATTEETGAIEEEVGTTKF